MVKSASELARARKNARIKAAVIESGGSVAGAAALLNMRPRKLSLALNHWSLGAWWQNFKLRRFRENARGRWERARRRKVEMGHVNAGRDPALYCKWLQADPTTRLRRPKKTPDQQ